MKKVAVIMGSDSDLPVMTPAIDLLRSGGVEHEVRIMSAHRSPKAACDFAASARANDFGVIIAAAGKAAHLAGVLAAHTTLPVIGVPIKSSTLDGLDALLSTVQMPAGVPVATVTIDGAKNAAILALEILAVADAELAKLLRDRRLEMEQQVKDRDLALQERLASLTDGKGAEGNA